MLLQGVPASSSPPCILPLHHQHHEHNAHHVSTMTAD